MKPMRRIWPIHGVHLRQAGFQMELTEFVWMREVIRSDLSARPGPGRWRWSAGLL